MDSRNQIYIYEASEQYLDWAHKISINDKGKFVTLSDEDYSKLMVYDSVINERAEFLEELWLNN